MLKIVADSKIPFLRGALENHARVEYFHGSEIGPQHVKDADALIVRTRTRCNEKLLSGSSVKYIATATIGFDHIDAEYCSANGISWSNAPGCNSGSVLQYIASSLAHITSVSGRDFGQLSLGIVGVGHVGKKVEKLARLLGMKVLLNDPPRERNEGSAAFTNLGRLLEESDIITMHVPLNREGDDRTFHLAGEDFFDAFIPQGWFINTSRGEVMDTDILVRSLQSGHLSGSIIDVWENEPCIDPQLLSLAEISTPHIAGYSLDGKANGTAWSVRAISRFFGLGLDRWYPENIPVPVNGMINIEKDYQGVDNLLRRLFFHCYNIRDDSSRLKASPGNFELFRDNYPPRREYGAFRLNFENPGDPVIKRLKDIGFKT